MAPTTLVALEGGLLALLLVGFCLWQIRDVRRAQRDREAREREERTERSE